MQMNRGLLRLNALVHGVGCGRTFQGEAVAVIGKCLDHFRDDVGVEVLTVEYAVNVDVNLISGLGMAPGRFAFQPLLSNLPEVDLLSGTERCLRGDGSTVGLGGNGIDLPVSGMEGLNRRRGLHGQPVEQKQSGQRGESPHTSPRPID